MDLNSIMQTAIRSAYRAGAILTDSFGKITDFTKKGDIDLVTAADIASEAAIISTIRERYPDHAILAEESGTLQGLSSKRWIIDPLDGTTNFAHGLPIYCISIAFACDNEVVVGVVLNPNNGELYTAIKGQGALLNKHPINVSDTDGIHDSLLATGFPYNVRVKSRSVIERLHNCLMSAQGIRRLGAAALDLCHVACGRIDGFWEEDLKPWDVAAGTLIVREAHGQVTDYRNEPIGLYHTETLATNGRIHNDMMALLLEEARQ